jgi:hypothetical protein
MRPFFQGAIVFSLVLVVFGVFVACGTASAVAKKSAEQEVSERVDAYWKAKVEGRYADAYGFEDPLFRRTVSIERYIKTRGVAGRWKKYSIKDIKLNGDSAETKVVVLVDFSFLGAKKDSPPINVKGRWSKIDGTWYHVPPKRE